MSLCSIPRRIRFGIARDCCKHHRECGHLEGFGSFVFPWGVGALGWRWTSFIHSFIDLYTYDAYTYRIGRHIRKISYRLPKVHRQKHSSRLVDSRAFSTRPMTPPLTLNTTNKIAAVSANYLTYISP